jgi:hypothetical protein
MGWDKVVGKRKLGPCVKVISLGPRASLFMHDISNRKTSVALESPSYYTSLQLKSKNKTNKQKSMPLSLQILNLLITKKGKEKKTFFFTNPKEFYLSTFVLKEKKKQKIKR